MTCIQNQFAEGYMITAAAAPSPTTNKQHFGMIFFSFNYSPNEHVVV